MTISPYGIWDDWTCEAMGRWVHPVHGLATTENGNRSRWWLQPHDRRRPRLGPYTSLRALMKERYLLTLDGKPKPFPR